MARLFFCIDGLDGCGKTTQARLLARWLRGRGYKVRVTDEPTDGPIGRIIKTALRGGVELPVPVEALLFAADRAQHIEKVIRPALKAGEVVVTERYVYSSLAYQSARGLPTGWLEAINRHAPEPDLTILIDVLPEVSMARIGRKRKLDKFESDLKLQRRVRQKYLALAKRKGLKVVDGARSVKAVQSDIRELVDEVL